MTVELRPVGVHCNIQCQYCYQNPQRDAGNVGHTYNLERMKAAIEAEGGPFALFGGEPLLVSEPDLEALWAWGLEKYGSNSLQTNGVLINENHIRLFKQYNVHVGISVDGSGELNDARWSGTLASTRDRRGAGITDDRLDFVMPDFTRVTWVSLQAQEVWAERLGRLRDVWPEIEWRSVAGKVRSCALLPDGYSGGWAEHGLAARLVGEGAGQLVVGKPANVDAFLRALDAGDVHEMGRLLGHPACCLEFQHRVWAELGLEDTTWPMALAGSDSPAGLSLLEMDGPPQTNVLWRWLGVRLVPHLPCRPGCPHTIALADQLAQVAFQAGFEAEMSWLMEVLSWPVEWTSLHGIAEVRTPVLKISTRTDPLASTHTVRRPGKRYPDEGASALRFPYRQARPALLTLSHGFRRGLENAAALAGKPIHPEVH